MDNMSTSQIAPVQAKGASEQLARLETEVQSAQKSLEVLAPVLSDMQIKFKKTDQDRIDNIAEQVRVGSGIDVGCIICFAGNGFVPEGFVPCQHQELNRNEYAELFNVIGTRFGEGDGKTTFNVPAMPATSTENGLPLHYIIKTTTASPRKIDAYADVVDGTLNITTMYAPDRPQKFDNFTPTIDQQLIETSENAVSGKAVYSSISSLMTKVETESAKKIEDVTVDGNVLAITWANGTKKTFELASGGSSVDQGTVNAINEQLQAITNAVTALTTKMGDMEKALATINEQSNGSATNG